MFYPLVARYSTNLRSRISPRQTRVGNLQESLLATFREILYFRQLSAYGTVRIYTEYAELTLTLGRFRVD
ncbi:hypothetical protein BES34_016485 [Leptospira inadai serovar Lyme]|uniref:Uncharacterized protein n=1 Tax=Leptospira inadai serovar Lyme TaxID=293084 RepID=A0ABX4YF34_9LEPT|nr:hypothetical protein BES34_016485 [Leptospira inadai serovar Lyme]